MARAAPLYTALVLGTVIAWTWAFAVCGVSPFLLGTAGLAYALGLRHAVDADHIAAIDNTTRKLMQAGERPVSVGLWFSLGHSTVVVLACAAVGVASGALRPWLATFGGFGGAVGTAVSAGFLFLIALANVGPLMAVWRAWRAAGRDEAQAADLLGSAGPSGPLSRLLRPLMTVVTEPWHMYPLGFLFGLGFDTASEVGLLAISASQATQHMPLAAIMVFPALFTAGMTLIDTTDGMLMAGAYGWAFVKPRRKLAYNFAITLASILVAAGVGAVEAWGLAGERFAPAGRLGRLAAAANSHMGALGAAIIALFVIAWIASMLLARTRDIAVPRASPLPADR
jgi:high-affinity nickel-transport protein